MSYNQNGYYYDKIIEMHGEEDDSEDYNRIKQIAQDFLQYLKEETMHEPTIEFEEKENLGSFVVVDGVMDMEFPDSDYQGIQQYVGSPTRLKENLAKHSKNELVKNKYYKHDI